MSEVRLACVVQHHPARAEILTRLLERLAAPTVVEDPGGPGISAWRCYRLCLRAAPDATHVLVLQDDTIPCQHFEEAAVKAIAARPEAAVCFYLGGHPATTAHHATVAMRKGQRWVQISRRDYVPTVATCYPQAMATELAAWVDERYPHSRGDDAPVGNFFRAAYGRLEAWATVPSLVQHPDDTPSMVGRRALAGKNPGRVAKWFIGDADAREIAW